MARVFRSPLARRDIVEVLRYTRDRWGKEQAREYRDLIREALNAIAAEPQLGRVRGTRPGILSCHIKQPGRNARHVLFYRVTSAGAVEVVRFLHDSMDFDISRTRLNEAKAWAFLLELRAFSAERELLRPRARPTRLPGMLEAREGRARVPASNSKRGQSASLALRHFALR